MTERKKIFSSRREAWSYLREKGIKVGKTKLYEDVEKGLLSVRRDGTVLKSAVDNYYKAHLADRYPSTAEVNRLQTEKQKLELKKLANQVRKQNFEHEREQGLYLPRSEFENEMVARTGALDIGLRDMFLTLLPEIIDLVDGDSRRIPDVLEILNHSLDEKMSEHARVGKFKFIVEAS